MKQTQIDHANWQFDSVGAFYAKPLDDDEYDIVTYMTEPRLWLGTFEHYRHKRDENILRYDFRVFNRAKNFIVWGFYDDIDDGRASRVVAFESTWYLQERNDLFDYEINFSTVGSGDIKIPVGFRYVLHNQNVSHEHSLRREL